MERKLQMHNSMTVNSEKTGINNIMTSIRISFLAISDPSVFIKSQ